jgi:hypothetical protein
VFFLDFGSGKMATKNEPCLASKAPSTPLVIAGPDPVGLANQLVDELEKLKSFLPGRACQHPLRRNVGAKQAVRLTEQALNLSGQRRSKPFIHLPKAGALRAAWLLRFNRLSGRFEFFESLAVCPLDRSERIHDALAPKLKARGVRAETGDVRELIPVAVRMKESLEWGSDGKQQPFRPFS